MVSRVQTTPPRDFIPFTTESLEQSIHARFEEIVRRLPDHIAVKFEETTVSYAELNATANRLARTILTHAGTEAEAVAILLGRGISPVVAMLAVLKAGKYFVPLDPSFPKNRSRTTIEHSTATPLITDQQNIGLAREVSGDNCRISRICLASSWRRTLNRSHDPKIVAPYWGDRERPRQRCVAFRGSNHLEQPSTSGTDRSGLCGKISKLRSKCVDAGSQHVTDTRNRERLVEGLIQRRGRRFDRSEDG